jgi:O-antigen/teichoic acid export membrane protein
VISKRATENSVQIAGFLAGGCFLLLVLSSFVLPPSHEGRSLIIFLGFALVASAMLFESMFQGLEQMEYLASGRVLKGV